MKTITYIVLLSLLTIVLLLEFPYNCTESDRKYELLCPLDSDNGWVCGHFYKKVRCLRAPFRFCNYTASNVCMACKNLYVEYVTSGACDNEEKPQDN
jgi:hypothetical protein